MCPPLCIARRGESIVVVGGTPALASVKKIIPHCRISTPAQGWENRAALPVPVPKRSADEKTCSASSHHPTLSLNSQKRNNYPGLLPEFNRMRHHFDIAFLRNTTSGRCAVQDDPQHLE